MLIGAVHDFSSLTASVRHKAKSIAEITREHLGERAGWAMLIFIWIAIVYVIIAFTDITSGSFVSATEELQGVQLNFNPGGAVGSGRDYLPCAIRDHGYGSALPQAATVASDRHICAGNPGRVLVWNPHFERICGGCPHVGCPDPGVLLRRFRRARMGPASTAWLPRRIHPLYCAGPGSDRSVVRWVRNQTGSIPFVGYRRSWAGHCFHSFFVTIACGACSGFHGLVCSGTTLETGGQASRISQPVGYGAMLAEGFVALIAIVTVMIMTSDEIKGMKPGTIYGNGIGQFLTLIIGRDNLGFAITFGAMAFSTFVFDTLDVCTRLGRYIIQELFGWKGLSGIAGATLMTVALPFYFAWTAPEGSYLKFWTLFGASNQLLAALTLLSITVWLYHARQRIAFTLVPMVFVLIITLWALGSITLTNFRTTRGFDVELVNGVAAGSLILLALFLALTAVSKVWTERGRGISAPAVESART